MASETVVSHNVMVSGLFPQHMGWSDEAIRDVDNVLGYGANAIVTVGDLGTADYAKLIAHDGPYPKLGDYLKAKFPGTIVANVGEKGYQVESMAAISPTNSSDYWVRMGSKKTTSTWPPFSPAIVPWTGTYRGAGGNPPQLHCERPALPGSVVSVGNASPLGRRTTTTAPRIDWPSCLYPEDGRYVKGVYPDHESGDIWVADAALNIMDNEKWSGLWVTFSAIDKVGHMWGGGAVDTLANYSGTRLLFGKSTCRGRPRPPTTNWATHHEAQGGAASTTRRSSSSPPTTGRPTAARRFYGTNVDDGANTRRGRRLVRGHLVAVLHQADDNPNNGNGPAALQAAHAHWQRSRSAISPPPSRAG